VSCVEIKLDTSSATTTGQKVIPVYEFVKGPLLLIAVAIFFAGFIYRAVRLFMLTEKKEQVICPLTNSRGQSASPISDEERKLDDIARFQNSVLGRHPVMTIVSSLFHFLLIVTPFVVLAHNVMIYSAFGIKPPSIPEGLADALTILVLGGGVFFFVRRIAVPKVAAISSGYDYVVLIITILPFLTGFLAYHQLFTYKYIITLHFLAGELMLIALPFTKIGHMVFFFFTRLTMAGEFCLGRGSRTWSS
jgi:nitrate reductase gamma subunit